jgi:ABC-type cobalamin/Fe3+-siderophores transport system ATPase subunit
MSEKQEHPLITWAKTQLKWQQHALRLIAIYGSEETIPDIEINQIKKILFGETKGEEPEFISISETDIPNISSSEPKTYLKSLGPVLKIDKLASDQDPFEFIGPTGLTIIFGNNGAGKSGYARILKNLCRSQGKVRSLKGDVTSGEEADWQVALAYAEKKHNEIETEKKLKWEKVEEEKVESDPNYVALKRIAFFDSHIANTYVDGDRHLIYFPSELRFYTELASLAQRLKVQIEEKIGECESQLVHMPETNEGTVAHDIISKIKPETVCELSLEQIDSICVLTSEEKQELDLLKTKKTQTPQQQKDVLEQAKNIFSSLKINIEQSANTLSSASLGKLLENQKNYQSAKTIAEQGAAGLARDMPIPEGIGSSLWFEMFEVARLFASEVYSGSAPPAIANGDHCVLCHQSLNEDARKRLKQLDDFMSGELQKAVEKTEKAYSESLAAISDLPELASGVITQQLEKYAEMSENSRLLVEQLLSDVKKISSRHTEIKSILEENRFNDLLAMTDEDFNLEADLSPLDSQITSQIENLVKLISKGASTLSENEQTRLSELENKEKCAEQKSNIEKCFKVSEEIHWLEACKNNLNTTSISRQSSRRSAELISDNLQSHYTNEVSKLGLAYLNISVGSRAEKGEQKVSIDIKGVQRVKKSEILSEGEQKAVALAGFLTEANEGDAGHAIIFDDPVSSLDWDRRGLIAERLAEEAMNRQVIIFTHDFSFALQLEKHAKDKNKGCQAPFFKQQWIGKQSVGKELQFGITGESVAAWESKKVNQRLQVIETKIQALENSGLKSDGSGNSEFERTATEIAKQLRQTWERAVEEVALNETIRRLSPIVMTTKLEEVQFDCTTDYQKLHAGMSAISTPAHDNPEFGGSASITLNQLKTSKALLNEWIGDLKAKRSSLN